MPHRLAICLTPKAASTYWQHLLFYGLYQDSSQTGTPPPYSQNRKRLATTVGSYFSTLVVLIQHVSCYISSTHSLYSIPHALHWGWYFASKHPEHHLNMCTRAGTGMEKQVTCRVCYGVSNKIQFQVGTRTGSHKTPLKNTYISQTKCVVDTNTEIILLPK